MFNLVRCWFSIVINKWEKSMNISHTCLSLLILKEFINLQKRSICEHRCGEKKIKLTSFFRNYPSPCIIVVIVERHSVILNLINSICGSQQDKGETAYLNEGNLFIINRYAIFCTFVFITFLLSRTNTMSSLFKI